MGSGHLLFLLASFFLCRLVFSSLAICPRDQSLALIEFSQSFVDVASSASPDCYPKTSSWNMNIDCCSWDGVICDEMSGHIIELDLGCSQLIGVIDSNSSLFQLSHLQRLNLSHNFFYNSHISPEFGRFSSLTHIDLSYSYTSFASPIPSEISHLSKLQSLLLACSFQGELRLTTHDFKMLLQNLTQLRELDLSEVTISSTIPLNFSSHLTTLSLDNTRLKGILPESIFNLPKLERLSLWGNDQLNGYFPKTKWNSSASLKELDLSLVNFSGNFLPESLGFLTSLQRLKLSSCNFSGQIPKSLWNLPSIEYIDLANNHLEGPIFPLLTSGPQNLNTLSLSNNFLNGAIPSWICSLPLLRELLLNDNHFSGQLKDFRNNSVLVSIVIRENQLQGHLPKSIQNLVNLVSIDLGHNQLQGPLPMSLQNLVNLVSINLGHNQLQGPLPMSIQNLVNLTMLDLSSNNFSGSVDASIFSDLKNLFYLDLSYNSISLTNENKVKSTLPQSLLQLGVSACEIKELDFLRPATNLMYLDLSNNKIQGRIPDWAWSNWMVSLLFLNLSNNMLTSIDQISSFSIINTIDLRSNFLQGALTIFPTPFLVFFSMSNNNLTGEIPSSVCNLTSLRILDLAKNSLKGAIPQCLGNMSDQLEVLDMQHNSLSGNLQTTFSSGSQLRSFNLHDNKLEGKIPRSLANCKKLEVLDLGNNLLNDTFPMWLGALPNLQVLSLRSNKLQGPIRTSSSSKLFPQLRMLDLSGNAFTAELPTSLFRNLKAMRRIDQIMKAPGDTTKTYYQDSVTVVTKGLELKVVRILSLYSTMDLSSNKFKGNIPSMMGDLIVLRVLNLSHNGLHGQIPPSLGKLSVVESLDLSSNKLSGEIPQQLASLTSLAVLNLSLNHLEGCIPKGPQFATFENNSYEGNDGLRGFPVSGSCGSNWTPETNNTTFVPDEESDSTFLSEFSWIVVLMGYGCGLIIGFSISYVMLSSRNPNWLSRIAEDLEYRIIMRRRKKQRYQMDCRRRRRRNNGI